MAVYLDHNASTPLHPEVLDAMLPFLQAAHGNASSLHRSGRFLRSAIEQARAQVAELVNARPEQVMFTSGGSEANNTAIKGFLSSSANFLSSPIEHASLLGPLAQAQQSGSTVDWLEINEHGVVDLAAARSRMDSLQPDFFSLQLANNETGAIQPVGELARLAHQVSLKTCLVHSDATQAIGKIEVDFEQLDVDLMTLSGHKFGGPQAAGALIIKQTQVPVPLISGGHQEAGRRAGTENTALLAGLGKAAELARINLLERQSYLLELRRLFERQLSQIEGVQIFSEAVERLPNTSFFALPFYHGETLLMQLDQAGFECASGSACQSGVTTPSHVLSAMGIADELALNAVRVSFGMENTAEQVEQLIETLKHLINQLPAAMRRVAC